MKPLELSQPVNTTVVFQLPSHSLQNCLYRYCLDVFSVQEYKIDCFTRTLPCSHSLWGDIPSSFLCSFLFLSPLFTFLRCIFSSVSQYITFHTDSPKLNALLVCMTLDRTFHPHTYILFIHSFIYLLLFYSHCSLLPRSSPFIVLFCAGRCS